MFSLILALLLQPVPVGSRGPVQITHDQASLLKAEAEMLKGRTTAARTQLTVLEAKRQFGPLKDALSKSVSVETEAVAKTRNAFYELGATDQQRQAATTFFGDILVHYTEMSRRITKLEPSQYTTVRDETFLLFEDNYQAYTIVATAGSLTFDLDVKSTPQGAAVSHKLSGDTSYRNDPDPTDTQIQNLEYAVWTVRVQKEGYKDQEKTHNPWREKNHIVYFILEK